MFQGGEIALQANCGGFNSHRLHKEKFGLLKYNPYICKKFIENMGMFGFDFIEEGVQACRASEICP